MYRERALVLQEGPKHMFVLIQVTYSPMRVEAWLGEETKKGKRGQPGSGRPALPFDWNSPSSLTHTHHTTHTPHTLPLHARSTHTSCFAARSLMNPRSTRAPSPLTLSLPSLTHPIPSNSFFRPMMLAPFSPMTWTTKSVRRCTKACLLVSRKLR